MGLVRLVGPAGQVITTADAKMRCRIDDSFDDASVQQFIQAATRSVENHTGRALLTQQWAATFDAFQSNMRIPLPPLVSVDSVKYYDSGGILQVLPNAVYGVDSTGLHGSIFLLPNQSWPQIQLRPSAVRVEFTCGYGAAADIEPDIILAVYLLVGHYNQNREAVSAKNSEAIALPYGVEHLLSPYVIGFLS